jgi:hypothetical protein
MMSFKNYKTLQLIAIILLLSGGIDLIIMKWLLPALNLLDVDFIRAPSNAAIIGTLLLIYNNFLWKLPVFRWLVTVPDMTGRYEGEIEYQFYGKLEKKNCVIEVKQSASSIKFFFYFNNDQGQKTASKSLAESVMKADDGSFEVYLYYNNSGTKVDSTLSIHEGCNILKYIPGDSDRPSKFKGHYFTNRNPQTRGEIMGVFSTKQIRREL